jgi:hypothetical protein
MALSLPDDAALDLMQNKTPNRPVEQTAGMLRLYVKAVQASDLFKPLLRRSVMHHRYLTHHKGSTRL